MHHVHLNFYGVGVCFKSDNQELTRDIQRDFSFFASKEDTTKIIISASFVHPPYASLPAMVARYVSPRNICYYNNHIKYIDYSGKALVIFNQDKLRCDMHSIDYPLLHEICYMTIMSLVASELDAMGLHRVHALGFTIGQKAVLLLMDMGGGKTTMALKILSLSNTIKLLSEDSPLINPHGDILPFPLRIGVNEQEVPDGIPHEYLRRFQRQEFWPKTLIDVEYFKEKISTVPARPHLIILGKRVLGRNPSIEPVSKYAALGEFIKNSVVGVGLYQGIEYIFQKGPREILLKIPLGLSRLRNSLKVIKGSKTFVFYLGQDKEENTSTLLSFLEQYKPHND
ncbi:MAG: hypothetical protein KKF80_04725 [Candidatus Omnitrophica bacterium]|nr:hypothetical protein [Candidatus Omnitrophota bacterium]